LKIVALRTVAEIVKSQANWIEAERAQASQSICESGATGESYDPEEGVPDFGSDTGPVDKFERSKQLKTDLCRGIAKFNFKPKIGMKFLEEIGALNVNDALDVASFLRNNEGLEKTVIGDYLGEDITFNKAVLREFTDLNDFAQLQFTESIRVFLSFFRLPGEA
jgi:brefeldin A-inhibited guanine nucleotide-exchange protein